MILLGGRQLSPCSEIIKGISLESGRTGLNISWPDCFPYKMSSYRRKCAFLWLKALEEVLALEIRLWMISSWAWATNKSEKLAKWWRNKSASCQDLLVLLTNTRFPKNVGFGEISLLWSLTEQIWYLLQSSLSWETGIRVEKVGFDILMLLSNMVLKNCGLRGDLIATEKAPACILAWRSKSCWNVSFSSQLSVPELLLLLLLPVLLLLLGAWSFKGWQAIKLICTLTFLELPLLKAHCRNWESFTKTLTNLEISINPELWRSTIALSSLRSPIVRFPKSESGMVCWICFSKFFLNCFTTNWGKKELSRFTDNIPARLKLWINGNSTWIWRGGRENDIFSLKLE